MPWNHDSLSHYIEWGKFFVETSYKWQTITPAPSCQTLGNWLFFFLHLIDTCHLLGIKHIYKICNFSKTWTIYLLVPLHDSTVWPVCKRSIFSLCLKFNFFLIRQHLMAGRTPSVTISPWTSALRKLRIRKGTHHEKAACEHK